MRDDCGNLKNTKNNAMNASLFVTSLSRMTPVTQREESGVHSFTSNCGQC